MASRKKEVFSVERTIERGDVLAYLNHYLVSWPPFNEVPGFIRTLMKEIAAGEHVGYAEKEELRERKRRAR